MAAELDKYRSYGQRIEALIRPATFPLAVKRIASEAELLTEYKRPSRDMGVQNFVCRSYSPAFQADFEKAAVSRAGGTIEKK